MNVLIAWVLEQVFMKRDNLLGSIGLALSLTFIVLYTIFGSLQFALWGIASGIIAFMGGLEINFDTKTKRQLILFKQVFKDKRI